MAWAAAIGMVGGIATAYLKGDAARKAANERLNAIKQMEEIAPDKEQELARKADTERFAGQLKLQKDVDPTVAALREKGASALLASLDTKEDASARELASKLAAENLEPDEKLEALKEKLLADAQAELDRGAELPPEFQAELVRTGLESAGSAGFAPSTKGGAAKTARTLLGAAGVALKEQRRQAAVQTAGAVSDLKTARANILSRIVPTLTSLGDATAARAGKAFLTASNEIPEYGLSGAEMVNLDLARINQKNKKLMTMGGIEAEKKIATGQMYGEMIGAGTGAFSGGPGGGGTSGLNLGSMFG